MTTSQSQGATSLVQKITALPRTLAHGAAGLSTRGRAAVILASLAFVVLSFALLKEASDHFLVAVPEQGGQTSEGMLGSPRFVNPVLAKTDTDRNLCALVFSGLMKPDAVGGLVPDLAQSYEVASDGKTYTFSLRPDAVWQDGTPITSADVAFTVAKVLDPSLETRSPHRAAWAGVTVTTPDANTVVFTLATPYAPFLENTTLGIIPKHIWESIPENQFESSDRNIDAIGSGPFQIKGVTRDKAQMVTSFSLASFPRSTRGRAHLDGMTVSFFGNTNDLLAAVKNGSVAQADGFDPDVVHAQEKSGDTVVRAPLSRVFAAFLNPKNAPILDDAVVREALDTATDRDAIIRDALLGEAVPVYGPLGAAEGSDLLGTSSATSTDHARAARDILEGAGWTWSDTDGAYTKKTKKDTLVLALTITTPDIPELVTAAHTLATQWTAAGIKTSVETAGQSTFASLVLAQRSYSVLLYGQVLGREPDLYAYWHSSQKDGSGLNFAGYANAKADKAIETARSAGDPEERATALATAGRIITQDRPAIFLYSPNFLYLTDPDVHGITLGTMTTETDRFQNVTDWYKESERVWKIFAPKARVEAASITE